MHGLKQLSFKQAALALRCEVSLTDLVAESEQLAEQRRSERET
jgi:hypothetical protein